MICEICEICLKLENFEIVKENCEDFHVYVYVYVCVYVQCERNFFFLLFKPKRFPMLISHTVNVEKSEKRSRAWSEGIPIILYTRDKNKKTEITQDITHYLDLGLSRVYI